MQNKMFEHVVSAEVEFYCAEDETSGHAVSVQIAAGQLVAISYRQTFLDGNTLLTSAL